MTQTSLTQFEIILPPTQDELPCDDGVPMETQRHKLQLDLLIDGLVLWLEQREDGYVGGNMFLYYSMDQLRNQDFLRPDFFAVIDVPKGERKSWVVWEQGKAPDVIIELLGYLNLKLANSRHNYLSWVSTITDNLGIYPLKLLLWFLYSIATS